MKNSNPYHGINLWRIRQKHGRPECRRFFPDRVKQKDQTKVEIQEIVSKKVFLVGFSRIRQVWQESIGTLGS